MKLATFTSPRNTQPRLGALLDTRTAQHMVDLMLGYAYMLRIMEQDPHAELVARARIPATMIAFLNGGEHSMAPARATLEFVQEACSDAAVQQDLLAQGVVIPMDAVRLLAPIPRPGKIISVGANYEAHIQEGKDANVLREIPDYPVAFLKMPSSVIGHDGVVIKSRFTEELDYEVELTIVIGKACKDVQAEHWQDYVAGYTIINDISMRDLILKEQGSGIVFQGKSLDTTCPMGPYLVTKDEVPDPDQLHIGLRVNGVQRQNDTTASMRYKCGVILAYWSRLGLEPGDVITTGTPAGVAGFRKRHPELLLNAGDVIEAEIEGLGILRNSVTDDRA